MKIVDTIEIHGDENEVLSVNLNDILSCIENNIECKWSILSIEGFGYPGDDSVLYYEEEVKNSLYGLKCDWSSLIQMANRYCQIIEIILIGDIKETNLRRYSNEDEMYMNCLYTIELVDSSYWIVHTTETDSLKNMRCKLSGVV